MIDTEVKQDSMVGYSLDGKHSGVLSKAVPLGDVCLLTTETPSTE